MPITYFTIILKEWFGWRNKTSSTGNNKLEKAFQRQNSIGKALKTIERYTKLRIQIGQV